MLNAKVKELLNQQVNIQKAITKRFGQQHTYGALAGARHTDQRDIVHRIIPHGI